MNNRKPFLELSKRQKNRCLATIPVAAIEAVGSPAFSENLPDDLQDHESSHDSTDTQRSVITDEQFESSGRSSPAENDDSDNSECESDTSGVNNVQMNDNYVPDRENLAERLCSWALLFRINHNALTALLLILRIFHPTEGLPRNARTLLRTPRRTNIRQIAGGTYLHCGLEKGIKDELTRNWDRSPIDDVLLVNLNIDGLPLAKSSKSQLWPILGRIENKIQNCHPFVIGVFHGNNKPSSITEFLEDFITECRVLMADGFQFLSQHFRVKINAVICDTPARTFVKCIKAHNAYHGCGQCIKEGDYEYNRVLFLNDDARLRTDANFRQRTYEDHHTGNSPFETLGLKMVTQFPLDYMHLCCLGVMKKMIGLLLRGRHAAKLRGAQIQQLSDMLVFLSEWVPMEFQRKCRSLNEFDRWKATEFRLFMLYLGPVVLKKFLPAHYYEHFNSLNCAMRILCHPTDCMKNNEYSENLLRYFVREFETLYGQENLSYNVHNLVHLNECVKTYGTLDSFSAFPFENHMQKLKKLLRKSEAPLAQIHRRITEQTNVIPPRGNNIIFPYMSKSIHQALPLDCSRPHAKLHFADFTSNTCSDSDNCCYLTDGRIVVINYLGYRNEEPVILGKSYLNMTPIDGYPCNSGPLSIYCVRELGDMQVWSIRHIAQKAFQMPYDDTFIIMPLLHCTHNQ